MTLQLTSCSSDRSGDASIDASIDSSTSESTDAGTGDVDGSGGEELPILPELPPDPDVLSILDGLEDNSSAWLDSLNTVGEWNDVTNQFGMHNSGPRGRDYSNKAVWMKDRKRAFFCGANHGAPHRLNDAWEFDLPSHTWVMLFAPDPHNAEGVMEIVEGDVLDGHGNILQRVKYVQTQRGGPTHYGHTWWGLAYDPTIKAALWMNVAIGPSPQSYIEEQTGSDEGIYRGPPLWAFYPYDGQWKMVLSPEPWPRVIYAGAMEYVPELGGAFWYAAEWNGQGMHVYLSDENNWNNLSPNDGENLYHSSNTPRAEAVMCHDRAHGVIVAQSPDFSTTHYDIAANTWSKVLDPGDVGTAPSGHDARTQMYYDSFNQTCLLFDTQNPDGIWSYSTTEKVWTRYTAQGPAGPSQKVISYFDEAMNVFVVNSGAETWVYRFRNP